MFLPLKLAEWELSWYYNQQNTSLYRTESHCRQTNLAFVTRLSMTELEM